jgi:hypothetical protein
MQYVVREEVGGTVSVHIRHTAAAVSVPPADV